MVGDGVDAVVGYVRDVDAEFARGLHVDVVVADSVAYDRAAGAHAAEDFTRDGREVDEDHIGADRGGTGVFDCGRLEAGEGRRVRGRHGCFVLDIAKRVVGDHHSPLHLRSSNCPGKMD